MDEKDQKKTDKKEKCFVIMPISDPEGYESGHFKSVYEDIFIPAIREAGFEPKRADDDVSSSMIQINIVRDIIKAPMAICDLSTRNPNVLFELGIRQAFDLPVVLVQEVDTPRIFDINTIHTIEYRRKLIYREVIEDQKKIVEAIKATKDNKEGVNSIIRFLDMAPAKIVGAGKTSEFDYIKLMLAGLSDQIGKLDKSGSETSRGDESSNGMQHYKSYLEYYNHMALLSAEKNVEDIVHPLDLKEIIEDIMCDRLMTQWQKKVLVDKYSKLLDRSESGKK